MNKLERVSVATYAELSGLSQAKVRKMVRSGELQSSQTHKGAAIRIPWSEVESLQPEALSGPNKEMIHLINFPVAKAFFIDLATTVATVVAIWLTVPENVATMGIGETLVPIVVGLAGAGLVALRRYRIETKR